MNSTEKILLTTPHKINVGFYGLAQEFWFLYEVAFTYLSIFRSTKIKTLNKYKLVARLTIYRLSTSHTNLIQNRCTPFEKNYLYSINNRISNQLWK